MPEVLSPHYPAFRYHRTKAPVVIHSPEAEEALGEGWANTPAAFQIEEAVDTTILDKYMQPQAEAMGKALEASLIAMADVLAADEKPKRGRPAGSKNKPADSVSE